MKRYSEVPISASAESTFKGFTLPPMLPNPEVPVQLLISPNVAAALPEQEVNFRVFGRTQAGDSVPVSATWSATSGTITDTNASHGCCARFRADTVVGNVRVVARSDGLAATALVRVRP